MKRITALLALLCLIPSFLFAQTPYQPSEENLRSRQDFADMKFGIFIHWGIYSMFAQGEWYMHNANLNWQEYAKAASGFYPARFNAEEWVQVFKDSGAKYITFTTRHHDSFSMWHTQASDYNIVEATPFKRDVVKELADACHKHDFRLHFYYSHLDWRRADYPIGQTGKGTGRIPKPNYATYLDFMKQQLTELLTNYGEVGAIWFDGVWDHEKDSEPFDWHLREQYDLIHALQPACLVGNNHHRSNNPGEDIQIFERDVPGENKAGYSGDAAISQILPLETCETMNGMWGYKIIDQNYKTTKELIHLLVRTAGKGANLLLNVGPQPNGELPAVAVKRLREMGQWLAKYGESIYATKGGNDFLAATLLDASPNIVATRKGDVVYLHLLANDQQEIRLSAGTRIKNAICLNNDAELSITKSKKKQSILLTDLPTDEPDLVIKIIL
ncbi:MAG: alpha-L-fucosidase [Bacteroidales bacterium]|nr:alpha-L-fucosidase [Candidatus Physcousia equi]